MKPMELWMRIPAVIRGILVGMMIQIIGIMPLFILISKNIEIGSTFPWALIAGLILMYLFWAFFSGRSGPFPASEERSDLSRFNETNTGLLKWGMISGAFLMVAIICMAVLGYHLTEVPLQQMELFTALQDIPIWTSLSLLLIASVVTGIVEEIAFRGYMQRIIERRHGPWPAIIIVALVFTIVHGLPLIIWPIFFLGSLGWGVLAYYSRSLVPGILFHSLVDLVVFVWFFYNTRQLQDILEYNVFTSGMNSVFITLTLVAVISSAVSIVGFIRLKRIFELVTSSAD